MKIERIQCDCCGVLVNNAVVSHELKSTHFTANCPEDGVNGGMWSMDVCHKCRKALYHSIRNTVNSLRANSEVNAEDELRKLETKGEAT